MKFKDYLQERKIFNYEVEFEDGSSVYIQGISRKNVLAKAKKLYRSKVKKTVLIGYRMEKE